MTPGNRERRMPLQTTRCRVTSWLPALEEPLPVDLIREEPLSIRVEGKPYAVIMRTPGEEIAHAAGFCLSEGVVDSPVDFGSLAFCDGSDTNVVAVTLTPARRRQVSGLLDRRGYVSQTSCGICGKTVVDELSQLLQPPPPGPAPDFRKTVDALLTLVRRQPLRDRTRATHAAALCSGELKILAVAEDVGRHNALDKAIGRLFLARTLDHASVLLLSSRISYELVQKAVRAGVGHIFSISRPTSLALELSRSLNITIGCLSPGDGLYLFERREQTAPSG